MSIEQYIFLLSIIKIYRVRLSPMGTFVCSVYPERGGSQQDTGRVAETDGGLPGNAGSKTTFEVVFTLQCLTTFDR